MAIANLSISGVDAVMKTLYVGQSVENMVYRNNVLLGLLPKGEDFVGRDKPLPLKYSNGGGRSGNLYYAQTYSTAPNFDDFLLVRKSDYSVGGINGEAIESMAKDKGSFVRGLKAAMDSKLNELGRALNIDLFGVGDGTYGKIQGISSGVITLAAQDGTTAAIHDVSRFEVGMVLHCTDDVGRYGDVVTSAATFGSIIAVNRSAGTITVESTIGGGAATPTGWSATYCIGPIGDLQGDDSSVTTTTFKKVSGLMGWCPEVAPDGSTNSTYLDTGGTDAHLASWFGATRTSDLSRLGGNRLNASAYSSMEEALIDAVSLNDQEGGMTDCFILHPVKWRTLVKELGSKVQYDKLSARNASGPASIGFRAVVIDGANGPVKVVADRMCPFEYGWGLTLDSWKLETLGKVPRLLTHDGNQLLRQTPSSATNSDDGYQFMAGYRGQLGCSAPGWNICTILP